ncbi:SiaB family protein kinase [Candidatus Contubernalis alkaliaceticus]|uniref:SiaB family protein kinase n=1 Tax=Candidatus Contubernalis alkaliaceticus TaxID=338645 RepID=UPI001F4BD979|nr:SiaB family protein kinase [Candidatus Contubernalis alkalaceticus]UNC90808.1 hypothetical protein HUE98_01130 [Candidatus Contubernalis alkalaceticus]
MQFSLYDYYQELKDKRIIFSYSGPISQASLEGMGNTLRRNLQYEEAGNKASLSVFSIFVEQVHNILSYSAEKLTPVEEESQDKELRFGIVVIGRENNGDYYVYCGNRIYSQDIPLLKNKIEEIKTLGKEELKALYKERRRSAKSEGNSKGAGLGLIEMARKAGKPIEYSFVNIDHQFSFFSLKAVVRRS